MLHMNEDIFRKESVEQMKTPDDLKQCIKVASVGMWLLLVAILIFMVGGVIWSIFARIETKVAVAVEIKGDEAICYICEDDPVSEGMTIRIENCDYVLGEHSEKLVKLRVDNMEDDAILHMMNSESDGWYNIYEISGFTNIKDGIYKGEVIIDSVSPFSFLTNGK